MNQEPFQMYHRDGVYPPKRPQVSYRFGGYRAVLGILGAFVLVASLGFCAGEEPPAPTIGGADRWPQETAVQTDSPAEDGRNRQDGLVSTEPLASSGQKLQPPSPISVQTPSVASPSAKPSEASFVGGETCLGCHEEKGKGWEKNPHHKIDGMTNKSLAHQCEACHGPGSNHVEAGGGPTGILNPKTASKRDLINICLKCHEKDKLIEARASLHLNEELSCISCHAIHGNENHKLLVKSETELCKDCHAKQAMEANLFSRHPVRDGQMSCTSCHNPHNGKDKMLLKESVNQLCAKCHNNYAGPFSYDHPPVVESCLICHKAHGSQTRDMLETRVPLLCFRCHGNTQATHEQRVASRQRCIDCHVSIHGSKHDKWFFQ